MKKFSVKLEYGQWHGVVFDPQHGGQNHFYHASLEEIIKQMAGFEGVGLSVELVAHPL